MIEEIIRIAADVGSAIAGLGAVENASNSLQGKMQGLGGSLASLGGKISLAMAPLAVGLAVATTKAIEFDTAMSGASRALDLSATETAKLGQQIKDIAPALGMTPTKMAELATEAGKLGVAKENIVGFSKVVAEIAAITDLSAAETQKLAGSYAALQTITGANTEQLNIYGAAVNKLDDAIGGTAPNIIEFTRQTAAIGKLLKLDIKDLAAYGSTMAALGIQNAVAYRSFNSLLTKLAAPQTLTKQAKSALQSLGIEAEDMAKIMTTDANAGIKLFLNRINEVSKIDVSKALGAVKQIIGADYGDEILTLAASTGKLDQALAAVSDRMDTANLGKKTDELAKKLSNVKGQQAIATAQMERLAIAIGSAVLPSFNSLLALLVPLAAGFASFAEAHPTLTKVALAIAAIAISAGPVLMAIGGITTGLTALSGIAPFLLPVLGAIAGAIAFFVTPIGLAIAGIAALGIALGVAIAYWDEISKAGVASWNWMLSSFSQGWTNFVGWLNNAIAPVAQMGSYITSNIVAGFTGLWDWLTGFIGNFFNAGAAMISNFAAGIAQGFSALTGQFLAQLDYLRQMLPGSEPKVRSPLSNLAGAGLATLDNFASGFSGSSLAPSFASSLGNARNSLSAPSSSSPSAAASLIVNDSRTINMQGTGNRQDIIELLKQSDRELLDLIDKAQARWNRGR